MNKYVIGGCQVCVQFEFRLVRVFNDKGLVCLMKEDTEARIMQLVHCIKRDYEMLFHQPLHISNDSLAIEIWAHVYAERLAHAIHRFFRWELSRKLYKFVKGRCEVIDCGEATLDNNRWIWNVLSRLKKPLFAFFKL